MSIKTILDKIRLENYELTESDILALLAIDTNSEEFYHLLSLSNNLTRKTSHNKGYVFMQIGLNSQPCSGNCLFCSLGADHFSMPNRWEKSCEEVVDEVKKNINENIDDLFLMTTADFSFDKYLKIVRLVKPLLKKSQRLVANIGDFDYEKALLLRQNGITGVYHVNRLREGIDTSINESRRIKTLEAIKKANLELYYCVEPIGAEHSYEEILKEILRAKELKPEVMAVMKRVTLQNTPMKDRKDITAIELTKIAAVTNLVVRPTRAMNVHEPEQMSLLAGVNQLYAELGANPRDTVERTELHRGIDVKRARNMLSSANYLH